MHRIILIFAAGLLSLMIVACGNKKDEKKDTAPKLTDAKLCSDYSGMGCKDDVTSFYGHETDTIHFVAQFENAPAKANVKVTWFYSETGDEEKYYKILEADCQVAKDATIHAKLFLNTPGWPYGKYQVVAAPQVDGVVSVVKDFTIE